MSPFEGSTGNTGHGHIPNHGLPSPLMTPVPVGWLLWALGLLSPPGPVPVGGPAEPTVLPAPSVPPLGVARGAEPRQLRAALPTSEPELALQLRAPSCGAFSVSPGVPAHRQDSSTGLQPPPRHQALRLLFAAFSVPWAPTANCQAHG